MLMAYVMTRAAAYVDRLVMACEIAFVAAYVDHLCDYLRGNLY